MSPRPLCPKSPVQPSQEGSYHWFQLWQFLQVRASTLRPLFTQWCLGVGGLARGRFIYKSDLAVHLLFCPSPLGLWWFLLLDLPLDWEWARVQFSLLISFSKVEMVANAFWWASYTVVKLLSTESLFLLHGGPYSWRSGSLQDETAPCSFTESGLPHYADGLGLMAIISSQYGWLSGRGTR